MSRKHRKKGERKQCVYCKKTSLVSYLTWTMEGYFHASCQDEYIEDMKRELGVVEPSKTENPVVRKQESTKFCIRCKEEKPIGAFGMRSNHKSLKSWCKECHRGYSREVRAKKKAERMS